MVILGEQYKDPTKTGKECEPLIWGEKLTCDERKKVIEIAAALWGEDKKMEMANQLMLCMAVETGGSFDPAEGYPRATGLIQFTGDAIDSMNGKRYDSETEKHHWKGKQFNKGKKLTKKALKEMTVLEQLDYVQLYLDMWMNDFKKTIADALDMYMTIWCPKAVGMPEDTVCYSKAESGRRYTQNKSIDGETYDEKGEKILKTLADGKITKGELWPRLRLKEALGKAKTNRCKTDSSTCTYGTKVGHGDYCHSCKTIHVDLAGSTKWISQYDDNWKKWSKWSKSKACYDTCVEILKRAGVSCLGVIAKTNEKFENNTYKWKGVIQIFVQDFNSGKLVKTKYYQNGKDYLDQQLEKGNPVIVGLDDGRKEVYNHDNTSEHFVVIIGKGCENNNVYYRYFEVGTKKKEKGMQVSNKLILSENNEIIGKSPGGTKTYRIVQIRKNK